MRCREHGDELPEYRKFKSAPSSCSFVLLVPAALSAVGAGMIQMKLIGLVDGNCYEIYGE
jgi:hypothetical protein